MIKDGGPAFPVQTDRGPDGTVTIFAEFGMSLRDYFAAKAMASLMRSCSNSEEQIAAWAYGYADAMLAAREKKP